MESNESRKLYQFFSRTVRLFFLFTGAGTALVGLYAFLPSWAMPNVSKLPYLQEYTIIIQHWGIMVGIMGICMMLAAMVPEWRVPILLCSAVEGPPRDTALVRERNGRVCECFVSAPSATLRFQTKGWSESRTMLAVEKWGAKDNKRKQRSEIFRPPFFDRLF